MKPLDRTDRDILIHLQKKARLTNKELAAQVDLAPSTTLGRVRRLEETGVVRGYHAEVDPRAAGIGLQALVAVRIRQHSREMVESFQRHALSLTEVTQVFHLTGESDFLVHVAVRDADHLRELTLTAFTERPEVARIETALVFSHHRTPTIPLYDIL